MAILSSRFLPGSVRGQVAFVLNGTLLLLFLVFLAYDYRNDSADRLELKRSALEEQARIIMPAVLANSGKGLDALRIYLVETHRQMEESHSDKHVVAVSVGGRFVQVGIPQNVEESIATALTLNASGENQFLTIGDKSFLVGSYQDAATVVYVAEDLHDVRTAISADLGRHLVSVAVALLCGILLVNLVLWLVFHRPLAILTGAAAEIGAGRIGLQIDRIGFTEFDIIASAMNDMSNALAEAEGERMAQMLKARTIQRHLLPARMLLDGYTIAHHFQPAETIGGDYYDLHMMPDGSGLFCIADVTGHGVSAALVVAIVKTILINAVEHASDPGEILAFMNRRLNNMDIPEIFVSMLLVRLRPGQADLEFAGAGHPPGLVVSRGDLVRELASQGPLLGIGIDCNWTTQRLPFTKGERLVLYTDGVTEASSSVHGLFDLERLRELAVAKLHGSPSQATEAIVRRLAEHCATQAFQDDVTLVLIDSHCDQG